MNLHDALDRLDGPHRKENVEKLINTFLAVSRDQLSRNVFVQIDGERRVFNVRRGLKRHGAGDRDIQIGLIPKQRQNGFDYEG